MAKWTYALKTVGKTVYMFIISEKLSVLIEYYPHVNKKTPERRFYPQLQVFSTFS